MMFHREWRRRRADKGKVISWNISASLEYGIGLGAFYKPAADCDLWSFQIGPIKVQVWRWWANITTFSFSGRE